MNCVEQQREHSLASNRRIWTRARQWDSSMYLVCSSVRSVSTFTRRIRWAVHRWSKRLQRSGRQRNGARRQKSTSPQKSILRDWALLSRHCQNGTVRHRQKDEHCNQTSRAVTSFEIVDWIQTWRPVAWVTMGNLCQRGTSCQMLRFRLCE